MASLIENLQLKQKSLEDFIHLTKRIIEYLPNVITRRVNSKGYTILFAESAGTQKITRPIKDELFLFDEKSFQNSFTKTKALFNRVIQGDTKFKKDDFKIVDQFVYTIQQSIGVGLDLLSNPNSARKHTGNRFEELIRILVSEIGIKNEKIVLKIPYGGGNPYSAETDLVFSPYKEVKSNNTNIDPKEIVVSLKTSSKDRMGKIFMDKLLMEQFVGHPIKLIGIFLNDVQRKEETSISYTFVSGLFMVYTKFLTKLNGVYFVDLPPVTSEALYEELISPFSKFLLIDAKKLIS